MNGMFRMRNHAAISVYINLGAIILEREIIHITHAGRREFVIVGMQGNGKKHIRGSRPDSPGQFSVIIPGGRIVLVNPFEVQIQSVQLMLAYHFRHIFGKSLTGICIRQHGGPVPAGDTQPYPHSGNAFSQPAEDTDMFHPGSCIMAKLVTCPPAAHQQPVSPAVLDSRPQAGRRTGLMPHAHFINSAIQIPSYDGIGSSLHFPRIRGGRAYGLPVHIKGRRIRRRIPDEGQPEIPAGFHRRQIRLPGFIRACLGTDPVMVFLPFQPHGNVIIFKQHRLLSVSVQSHTDFHGKRSGTAAAQQTSAHVHVSPFPGEVQDIGTFPVRRQQNHTGAFRHVIVRILKIERTVRGRRNGIDVD